MSGSSLTCDTTSYIYVTYGPRERCPEGRAPQPSSPPARAIQPAPSSRETGAGVLDLPSSGLPLPAASPASQRTGSYWRRQIGVHRQTLAGRDRKSATIRGHRGAVDRRGRHASPAGMAASGARAWLTASQVGHVLFNWNIDSIVYCRPSWSRHTSYWYPKNVGPLSRRNVISRRRA
jgi:hypothetical protein